MSSKKKVLRFVVTGALLGAPVGAVGCGGEPVAINEVAPEEEPEPINELVEPEPVVNEPVEPAPVDDSDQDPVNEPAEPEPEPATDDLPTNLPPE